MDIVFRYKNVFSNNFWRCYITSYLAHPQNLPAQGYCECILTSD